MLLCALGCGCRDRALEQRAQEIKELSDREDREYTQEALDHVEREYWSLHDHSWLGKTPDGTIIRLDSLQASEAPLPSVAFYAGWHLQLTISSDDWRTYPPSATGTDAFQAVYAITRHSATHWDIRVTRGYLTSPLQPEDARRVEDVR
jgi:hypothetical protein